MYRAVFIVHELRTQKSDCARILSNQRDLDAFVDVLTRGEYRSLPHGRLIGPYYVPGTDWYSGKMPLYIGKAVSSLASAR
jgi:hypothetical protein